MSLVVPHCGHSNVGFPRVSGDEPGKVDLQSWRTLFSPRERG